MTGRHSVFFLNYVATKIIALLGIY